MAKKSKERPFTCSCGSRSFIQEGTANFKEDVGVYRTEKGLLLTGGDPELDVIESTIKCKECGAEVEF